MAPESSNLNTGATAKVELLRKLEVRSAGIVIIGLGYVGLPLMLRYTEVGYCVLGFDIDRAKVERLNGGGSYIERITRATIAAARRNGCEATADFARCAEADALI